MAPHSSCELLSSFNAEKEKEDEKSYSNEKTASDIFYFLSKRLNPEMYEGNGNSIWFASPRSMTMEIAEELYNYIHEDELKGDEEYEILPFNVEDAKEHPEWVWTRYGCKARIISTDRNAKDYPIVGLWTNNVGDEMVCTYTAKGEATKDNWADCDLVLRVPSSKHFEWVVTYEGDNGVRNSTGSLSTEANARIVASMHSEHNPQIHRIVVKSNTKK